MNKNVIDKLNTYESLLHIYEKNSKIMETLNGNNLEEIREKVREILES